MIGKLRQQRSLLTFPVLLGFRAQVLVQAGPSYARAQAFNWKSRYSLFTDVCLLFAQLLLRRLLLLQENQRERKKGQSSSKRESIYRVSRNVSVFFATTTVKLFSVIDPTQTDLLSELYIAKESPIVLLLRMPCPIPSSIGFVTRLSAYSHAIVLLLFWLLHCNLEKNGVFVSLSRPRLCAKCLGLV